MLNGEKVLVTGGAGFIGSSLVERLAPRNDVTILDNLSTGSLGNLGSVRGSVHLIKASVTDRRATLRAAKECSTVFHLAALLSVPESFENPNRYGDVNVLGTANVLAAALQARARSFVFASSAAVYGPSRAVRIPESTRPNPKSPYAATKLAGEQLCDAAAGSGPLEITKLRVFNAFGPRQSASSAYASVIARFSVAAIAGEPLRIYGSGRQTRDFIFVDDVARAFELAASHDAHGEVINIGTGRARTVLEIADAFEKLAGRPMARDAQPRREGDIARSCADVRKAKDVLGFTPEVDFPEGLRRVFEHRARLAKE